MSTEKRDSKPTTKEGSPTTSGGEVQASIAPNPKKEKTIVSETHSSDGSYEIVYSDGSSEAGSGGGN